MENNVLIGGRRIDPDAPSAEEAADEAEAAGGEGASRLSEAQQALAAERRRADKLEGRVRALNAKVHELTLELSASQREVTRWKGVAEAAGGKGALRELVPNSLKGAAAEASSPKRGGPSRAELQVEVLEGALKAATSERDAALASAYAEKENAAKLSAAVANAERECDKLRSETASALGAAQKDAERTARRVRAVTTEQARAQLCHETDRRHLTGEIASLEEQLQDAQQQVSARPP